ncbi:WD40-repeat-containing domain protein [Thamnocephalis sphaerospora]|uniref:WD40-repeat-containing domain protein n=1 Tax=Thamnocephalis sphaerospora TaxID=78915 RepID=A0A4P9XRS4_9FUNG|nr:WD40-repeat-containing domain protein [Thamnocephalis sphaerospora]|eukprot:RKP08796.1 WD40-repeat-containing domain protein [Thamnocephalis sphaerospora]
MDRRKEELEKKRQKLAELRKAREDRRRSQQKSMSTPADETQSNMTMPSMTSSSARNDVDKLVNDLIGGRRSQHSATQSVSSNVSDTDGSDMGSVLSPTQTSTVSVSAEPRTRFIPEFSSVEAVIFDFPPKERVVYSKEAQTTGEFFDRPDPEVLEQEVRTRLAAEREKDRLAKQAAEEEERRRKHAQEAAQIRELSEDEKKNILTSDEFADFVDYSTKVIERALNEKYDFMKDYTVVQDEENDAEASNTVKLACTFHSEKLCQNRSVTDVNWSLKHPELLVSSYNKNPMAINEPDGLVLVWNTHLVERPEFVFHSQADVLTARFSDFHANLVIGSTYSGQILLWDTRAKSLPVLRTPLSAVGHTHPVYAMSMVGTQNAHNLISVSTDGLMCSWQLDMLAQPLETLELTHATHSGTDEVAVTCFGFPGNETTTFWVGTEEGNVYQANRYDRAGSKAGIYQQDAYNAHRGAVTGLHFHPLFGPIDFSDLFITSSVDWTVKLWRAKSAAKPASAPQTIAPIYSFEDAGDYVYDVAWSPSHPAMFASVDGTGHFNLWNLNVDTEVPVVSVAPGSGRALNKVSWEKEGRKAAVGSVDGYVHVYDIGEMSNPRMDEWTQFQKTVSEMMHSKETAEPVPEPRSPATSSSYSMLR